jgi:glycosyltransferase involved in cell wall biosynthesis
VGICHLILSYHPLIGGAEIQARRLASYQRKQGMQVCVIARRCLAEPGERTWPAYELIDDIPLYRVPVWGREHLAALTYVISGLRQLVLLRHRYQVIHAHMLAAPALLGGLAGRLLDKVVVAKASAGGFRVRSNISDLHRSPLRRRLLVDTLDRVLAINREIGTELEGLGFPPEQIAYVPNGIDVHEFAPAPAPPDRYRQRLGLPVDGPAMVYVGRLRPSKNLSPLLESLALLRDQFPTLYLVVVGAGEVRPYLEALVETLGLGGRAFFVGAVSDVRPYLHASDVFVRSSLKEGLSNAMLEAMATGLPVVATTVGGALDLIQPGENGLLLPTDPTPEQIARTLRPLIGDPGLRQAMGRSARRTVVECCAFEVVGTRMLSLYEALLRE